MVGISLEFARSILANAIAYEDYVKSHPIQSSKNSNDEWVFYVRFEPYWFAAGASPEAAEWTRRQGWAATIHKLDGVIWC